MTDLVTFGEGVLRLGPKRNERLESTREFQVRASGSAAATGVAAQRMGAETTWMTKLPESPLGHRVHSGFAGAGIDTEIVWSEQGRQGTYYIEHGGTPRGVDVIYDLDDSAFSTVTADDFDLEVIQEARGFYVTGITPALSDATREATANLLRAARQSGTTVALDVNYRDQLWSTNQAQDTLTQLFPAVDVLLVSVSDAKHVLDYDVDKAPQLAHRIAADHDFTTVVVTRGERGAIAWHDSVVHEHDGFETETTEPIGAGDAFSGAFVARRLKGDDIRDSLDYANATAALKRTIPGDSPRVSREEVEAVIEGEAGGLSR